MGNNWWANKLAQGPKRTGPPPFPQPLVPQGYQGYRPPTQQPVQQQQAPVQPQQQQQEWQPNTVDPTKMSEVLPIWQWGGNPRGGAGETATLGSCPACGSPRFFSRSAGAVMNSNTGMMASPKPECSDCGYPNEQGNLGPAAVTGSAAPSRQGAAPAPPLGSIPIR